MSQEKSKRLRANDKIIASRVLLITADGEKLGEISLTDAKNHAATARLDLVEIVPDAKPPVCKIMDYGKYFFEQSKKQKKKSKHTKVKEIKMRPGTDIGDYTTKVNKAKKFLQEEHKVKITVRFRGREMAHQNLGMDMIKRVEADLSDIAVVEQTAKMEGRQMVMVVSPIKK